MTSRLEALLVDQRARSQRALAELRPVLAAAGIVLPSAGLEPVGEGYHGTVLVELGRARPEHVDRLTDLLRRGLAAEAGISS